MNTKESVKQLINQLKKDKEFRETWKASIAVSFLDAVAKYKKLKKKKVLTQKDFYIISNNVAEFFLEILCS